MCKKSHSFYILTTSHFFGPTKYKASYSVLVFCSGILFQYLKTHVMQNSTFSEIERQFVLQK